jgi:hypothetical protein
VGCDAALDEPLQVGCPRDVADDRECTDPLRLALEHVAATRERHDVGALGGERLGAGEPDPGGGSADDRRAPAKT